ncbi:hypothetical protein V8J82_01140 [Gymnodinialimonas sp. 2305UL16-5]|uniref:hypothetical protein n=1 Tax=Gymnodinialimonas mytili TaxID=3126503 RepID=UPI0030AA45A6
MVARIELRRLSDDLVYVFDRKAGPDQKTGFCRRDAPFWITWRDGFGWGAWVGDVLTGRPWDIHIAQQSRAAPPEGKWVSQKDTKSYTYWLVHIDETSDGER